MPKSGIRLPGGLWNQLPGGVKNLNNVASDIVFSAGNTTGLIFAFKPGNHEPMGTVSLINSRGSRADIVINITGGPCRIPVGSEKGIS